MAHSTTGKRLGESLRGYYDGIVKEPLPKRWVDLIKCVNEKEWADREAATASPAKPPP